MPLFVTQTQRIKTLETLFVFASSVESKSQVEAGGEVSGRGVNTQPQSKTLLMSTQGTVSSQWTEVHTIKHCLSKVVCSSMYIHTQLTCGVTKTRQYWNYSIHSTIKTYMFLTGNFTKPNHAVSQLARGAVCRVYSSCTLEPWPCWWRLLNTGRESVQMDSPLATPQLCKRTKSIKYSRSKRTHERDLIIASFFCKYVAHITNCLPIIKLNFMVGLFSHHMTSLLCIPLDLHNNHLPLSLTSLLYPMQLVCIL